MTADLLPDFAAVLRTCTSETHAANYTITTLAVQAAVATAAIETGGDPRAAVEAIDATISAYTAYRDQLRRAVAPGVDPRRDWYLHAADELQAEAHIRGDLDPWTVGALASYLHRRADGIERDAAEAAARCCERGGS